MEIAPDNARAADGEAEIVVAARERGDEVALEGTKGVPFTRRGRRVLVIQGMIEAGARVHLPVVDVHRREEQPLFFTRAEAKGHRVDVLALAGRKLEHRKAPV